MCTIQPIILANTAMNLGSMELANQNLLAPDMAQAIQLLSRGAPRDGRSAQVAECLVRLKEIDGMTQVEQCRLSETGMTERQRIVEEQRSKRYERLAEVIEASVKEGAATNREAISARAEVSKQAIKGNVQIEEYRAKVSTYNTWHWTLLSVFCTAAISSRRRRSGWMRRLNLLPWLLLAYLAWQKLRKIQSSNLWQLSSNLLKLRWFSLEQFQGDPSTKSEADSNAESQTQSTSTQSTSQRVATLPAMPHSDEADAASPTAAKVAASAAYAALCRDLQQFLEPAGLDSYAESLAAHGYDVEVLRELERSEQDEMLETVKCLPGHKVKFRKLLVRSQS